MTYSLSQLESFVAVVEAGGISAAADSIGHSKSYISKQLAELESRLDATLLYRSTRSISPTPIGEQFFKDAKTILAAVENSVSTVNRLRGVGGGHLRVSAPAVFGRAIMSGVIGILAEEGVTLDISFSDAMSDLDPNQHDVFVRVGHVPAGDYYAKELGHTDLMLAAAPSFLKAHGDVSYENLADLPYVQYQRGERSMPWVIDGEEIQHSVRPKLLSNNGDALTDAAVAGLGLMQGPDFLTGPYLSQGKLLQVLPEATMPRLPIQLVYFESRRQPWVVNRFIEVMSEVISQHCPQGCTQSAREQADVLV